MTQRQGFFRPTLLSRTAILDHRSFTMPATTQHTEEITLVRIDATQKDLP
jgi:hypothetical protein